jgi:hypothetical protein
VIKDGKVTDSGAGGMLLRDWLAAHAPLLPSESTSGWVASRYGMEPLAPHSDPIAQRAWWDAADARARYAWADAMLVEREVERGS